MAQNQPLLVDIGKGMSLMLGLPTIAAWDNKTRPKFPKRGTFGFNTQTNNLEYWDGSFWLAARMSEA